MVQASISSGEKLEVVRAFVHAYRVRQEVKIGTSHRGGRDLGTIGELLYGALPHTTDGEGAWQELAADPTMLDLIYERVLACSATC